METKEINIAEILKNMSNDTKLYSSACGVCSLESVKDDIITVSFYNSKNGFMNGGEGHFNKYGKLYDEADTCLFPSKEMRDWSKFTWKKGNILISRNDAEARVIVIFDHFTDDSYKTFTGKYYLWTFNGHIERFNEKMDYLQTNLFEKATIDVQNEYIRSIESQCHGIFNRNTFEVEKPMFKDGDVLFVTDCYDEHYYIIIHKADGTPTVNNVPYLWAYVSLNGEALTYSAIHNVVRQDIVKKMEYATDIQKKQLFSMLENDGKRWNTEKKVIEDIKPKWCPKPFEKVIYRSEERSVWLPGFFSHKDETNCLFVIGSTYNVHSVLPYNEETAKLIGTTDNYNKD